MATATPTAPDPRFEQRVRASHAKQTAMHTLGARLERVAPGEVEIVMPAAGERFRLVGRVRTSGRTLTLAEADAFAIRDGGERLIATMTATMMTIVGRDEVRD